MSKPSQPFALLLIGLLTLIVSLVSSAFLFVLGLILIEFLLYPMALCISALFTGLTAAWLNNWLIADGRHTAPRPVVIACEVVAVVLAALLIILSAAGSLNFPTIFLSSSAALLLAATAFVAARRYRTMQPAEPHEGWQAVIWIILALVAVPLIIFIADLFGWAGA